MFLSIKWFALRTYDLRQIDLFIHFSMRNAESWFEATLSSRDYSKQMTQIDAETIKTDVKIAITT